MNKSSAKLVVLQASCNQLDLLLAPGRIHASKISTFNVLGIGAQLELQHGSRVFLRSWSTPLLLFRFLLLFTLRRVRRGVLSSTVDYTGVLCCIPLITTPNHNHQQHLFVPLPRIPAKSTSESNNRARSDVLHQPSTAPYTARYSTTRHTCTKAPTPPRLHHPRQYPLHQRAMFHYESIR